MNRTSATTEKMIERIIKACTALREAVKTENRLEKVRTQSWQCSSTSCDSPGWKCRCNLPSSWLLTGSWVQVLLHSSQSPFETVPTSEEPTIQTWNRIERLCKGAGKLLCSSVRLNRKVSTSSPTAWKYPHESVAMSTRTGGIWHSLPVPVSSGLGKTPWSLFRSSWRNLPDYPDPLPVWGGGVSRLARRVWGDPKTRSDGGRGARGPRQRHQGSPSAQISPARPLAWNAPWWEQPGRRPGGTAPRQGWRCWPPWPRPALSLMKGVEVLLALGSGEMTDRGCFPFHLGCLPAPWAHPSLFHLSWWPWVDVPHRHLRTHPLVCLPAVSKAGCCCGRWQPYLVQGSLLTLAMVETKSMMTVAMWTTKIPASSTNILGLF